MFMKNYTAAGMQQVGTYKALSISCTSVGIRFCGPSSSFIFLPLLIRYFATFFLQSHMEPFDGKFISTAGM